MAPPFHGTMIRFCCRCGLVVYTTETGTPGQAICNSSGDISRILHEHSCNTADELGHTFTDKLMAEDTWSGMMMGEAMTLARVYGYCVDCSNELFELRCRPEVDIFPRAKFCYERDKCSFQRMRRALI